MTLHKTLKTSLILFTLLQSQTALSNVSKTDLLLTKQILQNIKHDDYFRAKTLLSELKNDAAKQIGYHALYRSRGYITHISEIENFLREYPSWKLNSSIKSIVEKRIYKGQYGNSFAKNWFSKYPARTSEGKLYNIKMVFSSGDTERATILLRNLWRGRTLNATLEQSILNAYGRYLQNWDHKLRADLMMNANNSKAAIRNAGYAGKAYIDLYQARAALENRKSKNGLILFKRVVKSLKADMGLQYSLLKFYYNKRDNISALQVLEGMGNKKQNVVRQHKYWDIKFRTIHRLLDKKYDTNVKTRTYNLLANHQQSSKSVRFVDAEFKAGWIAFNYFARFDLANKHFAKARKFSFSKKHISRAQYWQAQTSRKLGDVATYNALLKKASKYKYSFYGQLAGERINNSNIQIPKPPKSSKAELMQINKSQHADFIKIYNYLQNKKALKYHYSKLRSGVKSATKMASIVEFAKSQNNMHYAMDTARKGMIKGFNMQALAYPNINFPTYPVYSGKVDKALSYGLIRQESLFDQFAISPSGARGYMQIMPATGKYLAAKYKVPYKLSWLHSKPTLNLGLGNSYIYDLVNNFEGSYVMGVAAYNAGGTWVRRWIKANGDPRNGEIKFVNWIEAIPKTETRNYVKKVTKNMQIYKARFNNNNANSNLIGALITGEK